MSNPTQTFLESMDIFPYEQRYVTPIVSNAVVGSRITPRERRKAKRRVQNWSPPYIRGVDLDVVKFKDLFFFETNTGVQAITHFPNGYGLSVIHTNFLGYGGCYEVAEIRWTKGVFELSQEPIPYCSREQVQDFLCIIRSKDVVQGTKDRR